MDNITKNLTERDYLAMSDERKQQIINFFIRVFNRPIRQSFMAFLVSAIALVACLVKFKSLHNFVEIIVYAACFYSLTILVIAIIRDIVPWAMDVAKGLPIIGSVIQNIRYRQRFFLYTGGMIHTAYLIFYFSVAYYYKSKWFYVIGLYNLCIAITRGYLSRQEHILQSYTDDIERIKLESIVTRNVAAMLFVMNNIIAIMAQLIVFQNETYQYHFIILYGLALYVFIRLIFIIYTIIRNKPHNNGIWKVVQFINLATAMVSLFTFQTALLHNYEPSVANRMKFNRMTGILVFVINQGIVIWLLYYRHKHLKKAQA